MFRPLTLFRQIIKCTGLLFSIYLVLTILKSSDLRYVSHQTRKSEQVKSNSSLDYGKCFIYDYADDTMDNNQAKTGRPVILFVILSQRS